MKTNKAQRLVIASHVAQSIRRAAPRTRERTIKVVNKDGEVVGTVTLAELQKVTLERAKVELETEVGVRPKEVLCVCGRGLVKVPKTGPLRANQRCRLCFLCAQCGQEHIKRQAWAPSAIARRKGCAPLCMKCSARKRFAITREQRSQAARKMWAARRRKAQAEAHP